MFIHFFLHYVKVTNKPNVAGCAYHTIVVYVDTDHNDKEEIKSINTEPCDANDSGVESAQVLFAGIHGT